MSRFTTILWDVDDTLLDFSYSQRQALTACFRSLGREITEEELCLYGQINNDYWRRLELGLVTREQLRTGRFTVFFRQLGLIGIDVEAFCREYQDGLAHTFRFNDDALTICRTLQKAVKQYAVSYGITYTQRRKMELSGLAEVLDGVFISEEVGSPKPHRSFFDHCLAQIGEKDKSRILIVGDSVSSDIKGGMEAGIATCWYRTGEKSGAENQADFVIDDLHQIYDLVGMEFPSP